MPSPSISTTFGSMSSPRSTLPRRTPLAREASENAKSYYPHSYHNSIDIAEALGTDSNNENGSSSLDESPVASRTIPLPGVHSMSTTTLSAVTMPQGRSGNGSLSKRTALSRSPSAAPSVASTRRPSASSVLGLATPTSALPPLPTQPIPPVPNSSASNVAPIPIINKEPAEPEKAPRIRTTPRFRNYQAAIAAPTLMHWSRAAVHGVLPNSNIRAHSATLIEHVIWIIGGCDEQDCTREVWCFDVETYQWSNPKMQGDLPVPCRAHTATLVDRRIILFGGGRGPVYFDHLYVLDTVNYRWTKLDLPHPRPCARRAHTAVYYQGRLIIFGGGDGGQALNDVWALDVTRDPEQWTWEELKTKGWKSKLRDDDEPGEIPRARGYQTTDLVGNVMVVMGGSDGIESFSDIWVLDLESLIWREVKPERSFRRLSHTSTQVGSYLFFMGGHDGHEYLNSLLLFNLVTLQFEDRPVLGKLPPARGYHSVVLSDSRLWLFGGFDGHIVFDDLWILDLAGLAYLPQVTSFGISIDDGEEEGEE